MDSPRTGSDELIYIETPNLLVTIKGKAVHPSFPQVEINGKEARLSIVCDEKFSCALHGDSDRLPAKEIIGGYQESYAIQPLFFEQQRYEIIIESLNGHQAEFWHENYNVRNKVSKVGRNSSLLSGVINFGNEIGLSDLWVRLDGKDYLKVTIEVFPSKISYKEDYQAIVADVTEEVYGLVFDVLKKTYQSFGQSSDRRSSLAEFWAIINRIYEKFARAADMVLRNPYHVLHTEREVLPGHKVQRTDARSIRWLSKHPEHVKQTPGGLQIDKVLAVKKYVTYDTNENRLTRYMLQRTVKRLELFKSHYSRLTRKDSEIIDKLDEMAGGIRSRLNRGFLKEIDSTSKEPSMSLVFGMAPGYRELFRCYLMLERGLSVTGEIFNLSMKDLALLYEYWCFIKLNSILKAKYELISQDLIKVDRSGLFVSLVKGQNSQICYRNPRTKEQFILSYNPKETSSPTVAQKPDNVLQLTKNGAHTNYEYVFDAKYRVNPALPGTYYHDVISKTPGPEIDDINTMHRYRDAIVYQNGAGPYERTMFGAYILFPYHDEKEYKNHHFYQSISQVNIGGLPFLPSATGLVTEMLDELISDSPDSAFERATLPVGIEEKLAKVNWDERDVLIGTLRSRLQFHKCYDGRYYFTSVDNISKNNLPIRYVAIYQSKNIFGQDGQIKFYGEVTNYKIVKRREITEVPAERSKLDKDYYLFEIKEWKELPKRIELKEFGIQRPAFTNMFLLQHSSLLSELFLQAEAEYRFYTELKRRVNSEIINEGNPDNGFIMGDYTVMFDRGNIQLIKGGYVRKQYAIRDFVSHPNAVFRILYKETQNAK